MVHISFWFMLTMLIYWGGSVHSIKENAETLIVTSKENGLEINADKTKYKVSRSEYRTKSQYEE